jgi:uncharacterized membrane protein (UPF0127 family)
MIKIYIFCDVSPLTIPYRNNIDFLYIQYDVVILDIKQLYEPQSSLECVPSKQMQFFIMTYH